MRSSWIIRVWRLYQKSWAEVGEVARINLVIKSARMIELLRGSRCRRRTPWTPKMGRRVGQLRTKTSTSILTMMKMQVNSIMKILKIAFLALFAPLMNTWRLKKIKMPRPWSGWIWLMVPVSFPRQWPSSSLAKILQTVEASSAYQVAHFKEHKPFQQ